MDHHNSLEAGWQGEVGLAHELNNPLAFTLMQEWQECYRRAKETLTKLGLTYTFRQYD